MTTTTRVTRHTCPVCRREIAEIGSPPVFRMHTDRIGKRCPMRGEPVPAEDGS